jgi:hypothetical protein
MEPWTSRASTGPDPTQGAVHCDVALVFSLIRDARTTDEFMDALASIPGVQMRTLTKKQAKDRAL